MPFSRTVKERVSNAARQLLQSRHLHFSSLLQLLALAPNPPPNLCPAARTRFRSLAKHTELSFPGGLPATSWADQPPVPLPAPPARAASGSGSSSPTAALWGPGTSARRSPPPWETPPGSARRPSGRSADRRRGCCSGCNRPRRAGRCQGPATVAAAAGTAIDARHSGAVAPGPDTSGYTPAASR